MYNLLKGEYKLAENRFKLITYLNSILLILFWFTVFLQVNNWQNETDILGTTGRIFWPFIWLVILSFIFLVNESINNYKKDLEGDLIYLKFCIPYTEEEYLLVKILNGLLFNFSFIVKFLIINTFSVKLLLRKIGHNPIILSKTQLLEYNKLFTFEPLLIIIAAFLICIFLILAISQLVITALRSVDKSGGYIYFYLIALPIIYFIIYKFKGILGINIYNPQIEYLLANTFKGGIIFLVLREFLAQSIASTLINGIIGIIFFGITLGFIKNEFEV